VLVARQGPSGYPALPALESRVQPASRGRLVPVAVPLARLARLALLAYLVLLVRLVFQELLARLVSAVRLERLALAGLRVQALLESRVRQA
jgi:hypothetical protein